MKILKTYHVSYLGLDLSIFVNFLESVSWTSPFKPV